MVVQLACRRLKRFRIAGSPRVGRNSSGFGLIDTLLGLFISALLIAPVMGGIFVVLKTATAGSDGSVITGQRLTNRQYFDLNLTSAQMRSDWKYATIVKTPPLNFSPYVGLDCAGDSPGQLSPTPPELPAELVVALQVRSRLDEEIDQLPGNLRGTKLQNQGLTRVVYSKEKSGTDSAGTQLYDLVRRECAYESSNSKPRVKSATNPEGWNTDGAITTDWQGWRLQPGSTLGATGPNDDVPSAHAVLKSIQNIVPSRVCNGGFEYANPFGWASNDTDPAYNTRCNLNFTVTFGNGSPRIVRLYQGNGF
jgi:hypothetical protein